MAGPAIDPGGRRRGEVPIRRFPHTELLSRAFALRSNVTVYDGIYLALADALDAPLVSCDTALADVPGCSATVEILPVAGPAVSRHDPERSAFSQRPRGQV